MKKILLGAVLFFSPNLFAAELPFGKGEEITYNIRWLFISCGRAELKIEKRKDGDNLWTVTSWARSLPFFDNFYKVRDRYEALWDLKSGRSLKYEKYIREGRHKNEVKISIDPAANKARWYNSVWNVTPNALDVLSALYFLRLQKLSVGSEFEFDVYTKKKLWPLKVKVLKREKIRIGGKKVRAFVVEPAMRDEGIFKAKGKILVWLTDDRKKIPVKMASKIPIGSIVAEMTGIKTLK